MKKSFSIILPIIFLISFKSFGNNEDSTLIENKSIKWITIEDALGNYKKTGKLIFIDMYTDWCGWCKVMDKKTFTNPDVIDYFNKNFVAVKFNAEQKEEIKFQDQTYEYISSGRSGIHKLAYVLMAGQASYPSFVILDSNLGRLGIIKGFKAPEPFLQDLEKIVNQSTKAKK